jgi:hypothetical protein
MSHIPNHLFQYFLESLGLNKGEQFAVMLLLLFPLWIAYCIKHYRDGKLLSVLYLVAALSFYVLLFTSSPRVRWTSLGIFIAAAITCFWWDARSRRRRRHRRHELSLVQQDALQ